MIAVSPRPERGRPKVARSALLGKSSTAISSSAGAPNLSGSITELHGDNSSPEQLVH